jgi:hypothetical protein
MSGLPPERAVRPRPLCTDVYHHFGLQDGLQMLMCWMTKGDACVY